MKYIGIVGSRGREDYKDKRAIWDKLLEVYEAGDIVVSGGCPKGADKIANDLCLQFGIPILTFYPRTEYVFVENKHMNLKEFQNSRFNIGAFFERNSKIAIQSNMLIATPKPSTVHVFRHEGPEKFIRYVMSPKVKGGTEDTIRKFIKDKKISIIPAALSTFVHLL